MAGAVWAEVANAAIQLGNTWMNSDNQRLANRTNVKLQRENRDWMQMMSDTAVQRRLADITRAGGNPALAFTNGQEATTPASAPAHVEPVQTEAPKLNLTAAMMAKANVANINADTVSKLAEARMKQVDAKIAEDSAGAKGQYTINHYVEAYDWDDLKTKIMRTTSASSAAQAKRDTEMADALIQAAKQQAAKGKIELDALTNIAHAHGIEAGMLAPIIKLITNAIIALKD